MGILRFLKNFKIVSRFCASSPLELNVTFHLLQHSLEETLDSKYFISHQENYMAFQLFKIFIRVYYYPEF